MVLLCKKLVSKKDGSKRFVVDYLDLNNVTKKDAFVPYAKPERYFGKDVW